MNQHPWVHEFPAAITVCDAAGIIIEMNDKSSLAFADDGGTELIGKNVLDCHPEPSRTKLAELLQSGQANVYTIEKAGVRKLIYQSPWYDEGKFAGIVEFSLPLPEILPHFVRDK